MSSMAYKRGQITIFIIVGVVILISISFLFYLKTWAAEKETKAGEVLELQLGAAPVRNYVESCLKDAALPGIYLLAAKGGYIYSYPNALNTENEQIAYHLEYGADVSPGKGFMQDELSRFIADSLNLCLNNLEAFGSYSFEYGEMKVDTVISGKNVLVKVHYPVTIVQEDSRITISDFEADLKVRLGHVLDVKDDILLKIKDSRYIDLDALSSYDVDMMILPYDQDNIVYSIFDNQSYGSNFVFNFAVRSELTQDNPPVVEAITAKTAYVGEPFNLKITASDPEGGTLRFNDRTVLFDIDAITGEIYFIPVSADIGRYEIPIIISDGVNEVNLVFELNISER